MNGEKDVWNTILNTKTVFIVFRSMLKHGNCLRILLYSGIKSLINQQNCGKIEIENREGGRKNGICNEYSSESTCVYKVR